MLASDGDQQGGWFEALVMATTITCCSRVGGTSRGTPASSGHDRKSLCRPRKPKLPDLEDLEARVVLFAAQAFSPGQRISALAQSLTSSASDSGA